VYFIQNVPIPLQQVHSKEEVLLNLGTHWWEILSRKKNL
jgi:hypothetical protein